MSSIWSMDPPVRSGKREEHNNLFAGLLMEYVIPQADKHYRTLNNPENRAAGGLSMPNILPDVFFAVIGNFNYYGLTSNGTLTEGSAIKAAIPSDSLYLLENKPKSTLNL